MRRGDTWDLPSSAWKRERRGYSDIWVGEVVLLFLLLLLLYSYYYTLIPILYCYYYYYLLTLVFNTTLSD